jgi:hypothetical protein
MRENMDDLGASPSAVNDWARSRMAENVAPVYPEGREDRPKLHPEVAAVLAAQPVLSDELLAPFENADPRELGAAVVVLFQALHATLGYRHFRDVLDVAASRAPDPGSRAMVKAVRKAIAPEE